MLVPGLWMPSAAMLLLAARFRRWGYAPHLFSYRGRSPCEDTKRCRSGRRAPGKRAAAASSGVDGAVTGNLPRALRASLVSE